MGRSLPSYRGCSNPEAFEKRSIRPHVFNKPCGVQVVLDGLALAEKLLPRLVGIGLAERGQRIGGRDHPGLDRAHEIIVRCDHPADGLDRTPSLTTRNA